jgi:hypothetical protein
VGSTNPKRGRQGDADLAGGVAGEAGDGLVSEGGTEGRDGVEELEDDD